MSESIRDVETAVREFGALPVPAGPERDRLRAAYIEALDNAHETHPCPVTGRPYWSGCVHREAGRVAGVGSCHSERRADAVLAVRDVEVARLVARVAELESERHVTNEVLDDAARALKTQRDRIAELEKQVRLLNTQRGDVAQLIEREGGHGEECVDIDDLTAALCLGSDEFGSGGA